MSSVTAFADKAATLTAADWQRVFDCDPLGWSTVERELNRRASGLTSAYDIVGNTLGSPEHAERLGRGRGNFLSHCGRKLRVALDALTPGSEASALDLVAALGPFTAVMTMRSVDLPDEVIATLRNDAERERVVDTYIRLRDEYRAGRTPFSSDLDNAPREIELALVAESARTRFPKTVLADSYLDLCLFTDPQDVERCRHLRLRWLGFTEEQIEVAGTSYERNVEQRERESVEEGWALLLSLFGFAALCYGIWLGTRHGWWTGIADATAGLLSYAPLIAWLFVGPRLPHRWYISWPGRLAALVLTAAIPTGIWIAVDGPQRLTG